MFKILTNLSSNMNNKCLALIFSKIAYIAQIKQMLNEKQFKVNPFYDKHYQVSSSSRHCSSNTSSNFLPVPNELLINESKTVQPNVFVDAHPLPAKLNTARLRRHSLNKEEIKCWCKNDSYLSRASLSVNSTAYSMPCENIFDTDKKSEMSQHNGKYFILKF